MTASGTEAYAQQNASHAGGKSIVVFYSRPGNNYVSGNIVNLKVGNTEIVAEKIMALTGCDSFKIIPEKPYPADYKQCTDLAGVELKNHARPKYVGEAKDFSQYSVIYLGYPIWWGTMPMVVYTFLESHDFAGKTIVPFSTHEGSGLGSSVSDIKKTCPKATVTDGLAIKGSTAASSDSSLKQWLRLLGLVK